VAAEHESDTRAEILRVALAEFERRGYYATSLRVIAARVGISKAAVLYHFPEKAELLAALGRADARGRRNASSPLPSSYRTAKRGGW
jgi:AcrR family transcriptional regulator